MMSLPGSAHCPEALRESSGHEVGNAPNGFPTLPSVAKARYQRWATGLCRVWTGRDGWASGAQVIECDGR